MLLLSDAVILSLRADNALYRYDLASDTTTLLSGPMRGDGPELHYPSRLASGNDANTVYVLDEEKLTSVELTSGDRHILATIPDTQFGDLVYDRTSRQLIVADWTGTLRLHHVTLDGDGAGGASTVSEPETTGVQPNLVDRILYDTDSETVFVIGRNEIYQIDSASNNSIVIAN